MQTRYASLSKDLYGFQKLNVENSRVLHQLLSESWQHEESALHNTNSSFIAIQSLLLFAFGYIVEDQLPVLISTILSDPVRRLDQIDIIAFFIESVLITIFGLRSSVQAKSAVDATVRRQLRLAWRWRELIASLPSDFLIPQTDKSKFSLRKSLADKPKMSKTICGLSLQFWKISCWALIGLMLFFFVKFAVSWYWAANA